MRSIAVISGSRADYGILRPLLQAIVEDSELLLSLRVTGMHLSEEFGSTAQEIETDGFLIDDRIEMLASSDSPEGIGKSMGLGTLGFAQSFSRSKPDMLVVVGDRYEIHAAVLAAVPFNIPIAHIHGGEETIGAFDNSLRQSISTLSHLHFPSTEKYGQRLIHMGEELWRITVSGALSLDNISRISFFRPEELEEKIAMGPSHERVHMRFGSREKALCTRGSHRGCRRIHPLMPGGLFGFGSWLPYFGTRTCNAQCPSMHA